MRIQWSSGQLCGIINKITNDKLELVIYIELKKKRIFARCQLINY